MWWLAFGCAQPERAEAAAAALRTAGRPAPGLWQTFHGTGAEVPRAVGDLNGDGLGELGMDDGAQISILSGANAGPLSESWVLTPPHGGQFDLAAGLTGDVNGDGIDDLLLSASNPEDNGLYLGDRDGPGGSAVWATAEDAPHGAGDVNGDGFSDVFTSVTDAAWSYDTITSQRGRVSLWLGGASGVETTPIAQFTFEGSPHDYVVAVAQPIGDVNGDGFDDAQLSDGLHLGEAGGLSAEPVFVAPYLTAAGDVNGDGFDDARSLGEFYLGGPDGLSEPPVAFTPQPNLDGFEPSAGATLGAPVGDVDGDQIDDVVGGDSTFSGPEVYEGRAYLYRGTTSGPELVESWHFEPDLAFAYLGFAIFPAGDVNGDGLADFVAAERDDSYDGRAYLFVGGLDGDGDGFGAGVDCDDADPAVSPGAAEVCDGRVNRCGGALGPEESDQDGDGALPCGGDCDDARADVSPDQIERCGDALDSDCDGVDPPCDAPAPPGCACDSSGRGSLLVAWVALGVARRWSRRSAP